MGGKRNSGSLARRRKTESGQERFQYSISQSQTYHPEIMGESKEILRSNEVKASITSPPRNGYSMPKAKLWPLGPDKNKSSAKLSLPKVLETQQQRDQRKLLNLQQQLQWIKSTPPRTDSTSEDDFVRNCMSAMSSASSSISWADDAVEAEFTQRLANLWEDIETVCAGKERPSEMTDIVYEECLQWRRAFPNQNLVRFSRKRNDSAVTPTSASARSQVPSDSTIRISPAPITPIYSPTDSRLEDCMTPNPSTSSDYVNAWLSECQNHSITPINENETSQLNSLSVMPTKISKGIEEIQISTPNSSKKIFPTVASPQVQRKAPVLDKELDPNNFYRSLALSNNEPNYSSSIYTNTNHNDTYNISEEDESGRDSPGSGQYWGNVRVQRPISSNVKGHMITPIPTGMMGHSALRKPSGSRKNSLPTGRTVPNLPVSSYANITSTTRANETKSSGYSRQQKSSSYQYNQQQQSLPQLRSRVTLSSLGSHSVQNSKQNIAASSSPYWSRHSSGPESGHAQEYDSGYFNTIAENYDVEPSDPPSRPNHLPLLSNVGNTSKVTENCKDSDRQPVKPFLFWLLDRVSPN